MEFKTHSFKVRELAKAGITLKDIGNYLGISEAEVIADYSEIYHKAIIDRNVEVGEVVYRLAMDGNLTACQFWLKNLGKWEEYSESAPKITEDKIYDQININVISKEDVDNSGQNSEPESNSTSS